MTLLAWHLWTCPRCGNRAAVLTDLRMDCLCGAASRVDATTPLVTDADYDNEELWR